MSHESLIRQQLTRIETLAAEINTRLENKTQLDRIEAALSEMRDQLLSGGIPQADIDAVAADLKTQVDGIKDDVDANQPK